MKVLMNAQHWAWVNDICKRASLTRARVRHYAYSRTFGNGLRVSVQPPFPGKLTWFLSVQKRIGRGFRFVEEGRPVDASMIRALVMEVQSRTEAP